mgnify:CR=1 FL=1
MPSKILYDTRTLEILVCQPKPHGVGLPSFNGLCRTGRVPENEKQYLAELVIEGDYLTATAKKIFKLVKEEGEVKVEKRSEGELALQELQKNEREKKEKRKIQLINEYVMALLEDNTEKIEELKEEYKTLKSNINNAIKIVKGGIDK